MENGRHEEVIHVVDKLPAAEYSPRLSRRSVASASKITSEPMWFSQQTSRTLLAGTFCEMLAAAVSSCHSAPGWRLSE